VIGSMLGNALGSRGLYLGAVGGGMLGVAVAVVATAKIRWLPRGDRLGAFVGGVVGFAIAAPIAVANLHTPITPVVSCGLAGAAALMGIGVARGWTRPA